MMRGERMQPSGQNKQAAPGAREESEPRTGGFGGTNSNGVFHLLGKDQKRLNLSEFGLFPKSRGSTIQH